MVRFLLTMDLEFTDQRRQKGASCYSYNALRTPLIIAIDVLNRCQPIPGQDTFCFKLKADG
jgi:hypothetical protein